MDQFMFQSPEQQQQQLPIEEVLSIPIVLSERVRLAVAESKSFRIECADVGKRVDRLTQMLRCVVWFVNSTPSVYDRPVRCIFTDVVKTLNRALALVRKCRRRSFFRRFVSVVGAADFRKMFNLIDASIADMKWLLSILDIAGTGAGKDADGEVAVEKGAGKATGKVAAEAFAGQPNGNFADGVLAGESAGRGSAEVYSGGIIVTLPPIATDDPILAWIWSYIASIYFCSSLNTKSEVAYELSLLAHNNDRYKLMIAEEGGIPPLLKLLKEYASPEAQIASAIALFNLANDQIRVRLITKEHGVVVIAQALRNSPIRVQSELAKLISRMAEQDSITQESFARENVTESLVTILSSEDHELFDHIQSTVEINNSMGLKLDLKTNCAGALWMLARGSVANSQKLTETKGLLCLSKLIETQNGELQINCLMTVTEITAVAESNPDLRRSSFKTNSLPAKAIVDQLLKLVRESDNPVLKIPAIRAIGSLARTFPASQTQVIGPLVNQLNHRSPDVITESVIALGKFAIPENFLCVEHLRTIVEFNGVPLLLKLLRGNDRIQYHSLILLCYIAIHAENNEALDDVRILTALEGADKAVPGQYSELRALVAKAIQRLGTGRSKESI